MFLPFMRVGPARANEPQSAAPVSMAHHQQATFGGVANRYLSRLSLRMVGVAKRRCERVIENGEGLLKRDAMFAPVARRLPRLPLETHFSNAHVDRRPRITQPSPRCEHQISRVHEETRTLLQAVKGDAAALTRERDCSLPAE